MLNINWKGQPLNLKVFVLWFAVIGGSYTVGANFPDLNPTQLIPASTECGQ